VANKYDYSWSSQRWTGQQKKEDMQTTDRLEITDLFARLARILDTKDHEGLRAIYTDDVVVHSPRGEFHGIDEVLAHVRRVDNEDELTQHLHTDVLVDFDGDQAAVSANQLVYFYRDGQQPHQTSGLQLTYNAVRTPVGWRVRAATIKLAWQQKA
jgi:ketosteroid isomerase-like protein